MINFLKTIEDKIRNNIEIEKIKIIDNTHKHKNHRFFDINKYHLCLDIKSAHLSSMSKVDAQRIIMNILRDEFKNKIHALEIKLR